MNTKYTQIDRVYSGRQGCMCGCRGTYSTSPSEVTRVVNKLLANMSSVDIGEASGGGLYFAATVGKREYAVYTLPPVVRVR